MVRGWRHTEEACHSGTLNPVLYSAYESTPTAATSPNERTNQRVRNIQYALPGPARYGNQKPRT
jgi:hypothetical protein